MRYDEPRLPLLTHADRIPPVSQEEMTRALRQSLALLPYSVRFGAAGPLAATIPLTSGRSVCLRPDIRVTGEAVMVEVDMGGLDEDDVPEVMAIHEQVIRTALYIARVEYARTRAAA
jgi:hypothetical protein